MAVSTNRKKVNTKQVLMVRVLIALLVIAIALAAFLYQRYGSLQTEPNIRAKKETQATLKALSRLMIIPDQTGVVVATVSDKNKLVGQDFFRLAENGDKVIVFPQAQLAVLYRPTVDKIVTIAPLAQSQPEQNDS